MAWLDGATGASLEIDFVMDPLPDKVQALETRVTYQYTPEGLWFAKEMTIAAKGGFLFITKYIDTHMVFSEHWKKD